MQYYSKNNEKNFLWFNEAFQYFGLEFFLLCYKLGE